MTLLESQELVDITKSGKKRDWAKYKKYAEYVGIAFEEIDEAKANRIKDCASYLAFKFVKGSDTLKLHDARFCRVRLCPVCQWRRSLKTYSQMIKIIDKSLKDDYVHLFLTLTVKNCTHENLDNQLTHLFRSFNRLTKYKRFQQNIYSFYRGAEITYNQKTDEFHPHLHCVIAVKKSYFAGRNYISQNDWTEMWQKALQVDYTPVLNIKKCYGSDAKSIAEACKYAVKPNEVLNFQDWDMTVKVLDTLNAALDKRRFVGLGGVFKEYHKQLNLDDIEDGDLTDLGRADEIELDEDVLLFFWNGVNYKL